MYRDFVAAYRTPASRRPSLVFVLLLGFTVALHVTTSVAAPDELVVAPHGGASFSTLSGAVAAAAPGSIILIRPGIYNETVDITKDLILVGTDPDQTAILDGEHRRPLLRIQSAVTCRVENLTFRNATSGSGAAAYLTSGAVADFINCTFHDNLARGQGGAVLITGAESWAEFVGCHFQRNRALENAGAVGVIADAEVTLRACTFYANATDGICGGVASFSRAPLVVEDCLFIENQGLEGGAVRVFDSSARIVGNTFFQNASVGGASVFIHDDAGEHDVDVTNNIFAGDVAGAGLRIPEVARYGCNLYSDNLAGARLDGLLGADELMVDPGFCDFRSLDLTLRRNSPASGRRSRCGRIGALDVGCLEGFEATAGYRLAPQRRVR